MNNSIERNSVSRSANKMIKCSLIKALVVAGFGASALVSVAAYAAVTVPDVPAIVQSATLPADMTEWMANGGTNYSWNPENVRLGQHPDRSLGVVYIFPDKVTADAWWDGVTPETPPAGIPNDAVAYIHWKLDNNSGEFPGIMAKTDDKNFKTNNCLMSSGTTIPEDGGQVKTCSNPQGSSKRFKLVVLKADEPIDLMFNTTTKELVYSNYEEPPLTGDLTVLDDVFRNYRYIMKFGNGTGTDSDTEVRDGTRLVGFKLELGTGGVGGDFAKTTDETTDGLAYELALCIADRYFDEKSSQPSDGTSDCPAGETEVWLENEYATFSPSMYSLITDKRTTPVGGYWDKNPAGIFAPQIQAENEFDSGDGAYVPNVDSSGALYDPYTAFGQIGQITSNYFDVASAQGTFGSGVTFPENMFGYLMFYGVFANGDPGNISSGIYIDDDGDPATEGGLYAWWDASSPTCCFRWGIDPDLDGNPGPDAFGIVSDADLAYVASRPMGETVQLDPPYFEIGYMDDLGGLNSDTFIKMTKTFTGNSFTIRMTAQSTATAGLTTVDEGVADSPWVANPIPAAEDFFGTAGVLQFNPVSYTVAENDGSAVVTVERVGGTVGIISVGYTTKSGTAIDSEDFVPDTATLSFADGETSKTITVALVNDTAVESDETFEILLSNAQGGAILGTSTATVTITDTDTDTDTDTVTDTVTDTPVSSDGDSNNGLFSLGWITFGLVFIGLLGRLRRKKS